MINYFKWNLTSEFLSIVEEIKWKVFYFYVLNEINGLSSAVFYESMVSKKSISYLPYSLLVL
jgi:hypothetical protein